MIKVLDYGMGNTASILNMIRKVGGQAELCSSVDGLFDASAIILPGVGSFDNGMSKLVASGILEELTQKVIKEKVPFLGICLGMQLLFDQSEEGQLKGLGWINGEVKRFSFDECLDYKKKLKIPHMGWNLINLKKDSELMSSIDGENRYYFVHSFHVVCNNHQDILATTNYGYDFTCAVQKNNIYGVQFHPEKSHKFGMALFKNFIKVQERNA